MVPHASNASLRSRRHMAHPLPSIPCHRGIHDVIHTQNNQRHSRHAMHNAAKFLSHAKHGSKPGVRIFQRESRNHQHGKREHQNEMLPALIPRQPQHCPMLRLASRDRFAPPDDAVVQQHATNHQQDQRNIECASHTAQQFRQCPSAAWGPCELCPA